MLSNTLAVNTLEDKSLKLNKIVIFDIEICVNRCMVGFKTLSTGKVKQFDLSNANKLEKFIKGKILVGFNSKNFDNIILTAMINGKSQADLWKITSDLISGETKRWDYRNGVTNDIDLIEVASGQGSLKIYGARLGSKELQELPYDPTMKHTDKMWKNVCQYNKIDLDVTELLFNELLPQLKLRKDVGNEYNIDVMSKGEAQIATQIYNKLLDLNKVSKQKIPSFVRYKAPKYIKFKSRKLQALKDNLENTQFEVNPLSGSPIVPKWLKDTDIVIGDVEYTVQLGGIHSVNKSEAIIPADDEDYFTTDVRSLYPSLMIENKFYPSQIAVKFGEVFTKIYDDRQIAKRLSK